MTVTKLPIVVLLSGNGTNLQAIIDAINAGLPVDILAVISNRTSALGIQRARDAHIPTQIIAHKGYKSREDFDNALIKSIDRYQPKFVILAGFMRKLGAKFVAHYKNRILNVHPSLLPKYRGLNTHERILNAKEHFHGVTIHIVNEALDGGPIICQSRFTVSETDTVNSLNTKAQKIEHKIYPLVLQWLAEKRLTITTNGVLLDSELLPTTGAQINNN